MTLRQLSITLFTVLVIHLVGCGQKGGLFLPEPPVPPEAVEPAEPESDEDDSQGETK